jgi:hypothetical protein
MAKVNFKFHVYKTANLFFFVSNLANWHFSTRPHYNKYWLEKTGPLSNEEKKAIKDLKKILLKYNFGEKYPGRTLMGYPPKKAWESTKKTMPQAEYQLLTRSLAIFKPRFEKIWKDEGKNLKNWQKILNQEKFINTNRIISDLEIFFGTKAEKVENIILLIGGDVKGGGGGANTIKGNIEQEIGMKTSSINDFLPVLWHEYIHQAFREVTKVKIDEYLSKNKIEKEILKLGYNGSPFNFLNEGICSSMMPNGALAIKYNYLNKPTPPINLQKSLKDQPQNVYTAQKFINVINYDFYTSYFENSKKFDLQYIAQIHQGYLEYLKLIK